jgi:hypothetical protein
MGSQVPGVRGSTGWSQIHGKSEPSAPDSGPDCGRLFSCRIWHPGPGSGKKPSTTCLPQNQLGQSIRPNDIHRCARGVGRLLQYCKPLAHPALAKHCHQITADARNAIVQFICEWRLPLAGSQAANTAEQATTTVPPTVGPSPSQLHAEPGASCRVEPSSSRQGTDLGPLRRLQGLELALLVSCHNRVEDDLLADDEEQRVAAIAAASGKEPASISDCLVYCLIDTYLQRGHKPKPTARNIFGHEHKILTMAKPHLFALTLVEGAYQTRATLLSWALVVYQETFHQELPDVPYEPLSEETLQIVSCYITNLSARRWSTALLRCTAK